MDPLLSESSEEVRDFRQRKNQYICPPEALIYILLSSLTRTKQNKSTEGCSKIQSPKT